MGQLERVLGHLGLGLLRLADASMLNGSLSVIVETGSAVRKELGARGPGGLNWRLPYQEAYPGEVPNLLRVDGSLESAALPQVPLFLPDASFDPGETKIDLMAEDFSPEVFVSDVLERHKRAAQGKLFFDGENARLVSASTDTFLFQGCRYFQYISTNLALDHPGTVLGSLRNQIHPHGALEPMEESPLANSTGVNGLVFSSDGQLVLQRRRDNVLIRPGEICSGFSGTIDKTDVLLGLAAGGRLSDLNATRELFEEVGIPAGAIGRPKFLGVTRELIRGGKPEMFYAVDVAMPRAEIERCYPQHREGDLVFVELGLFGRSSPRGKFPVDMFDLLSRIAAKVKGQISVPLMTNLVLWQRACGAG